MARRVKRGRGRQHLLIADPGVKDRFLFAVRAGVPYVHAATAAGVSDRSVQRWRSAGEAAQEALDAGRELDQQAEACWLFWKEVTQARAQVAVELMELIGEAARGGQLVRRRTLRNGVIEEEYAPIDWRAASKLLDISFRHEFDRARQQEMTHGAVDSVPDATSPSVRRVLARLRAERERTAQEISQGVEGNLGA